MNRLITNEQPKSVPVRKSQTTYYAFELVRGQAYIFLEFAISPQRYNRLFIARTILAYQSTQWLKRKIPNALSVVPAWLTGTHEAKVSPHLTSPHPERSNDRTFGGRVAEESRLTMIAGVLPTALISYYYYIYCSM